MNRFLLMISGLQVEKNYFFSFYNNKHTIILYVHIF